MNESASTPDQRPGDSQRGGPGGRAGTEALAPEQQERAVRPHDPIRHTTCRRKGCGEGLRVHTRPTPGSDCGCWDCECECFMPGIHVLNALRDWAWQPLVCRCNHLLEPHEHYSR